MPRERRSSPPLPPVPAMGVPPHQRLGLLRRERRLSMNQLAALAGVRVATICEFERGLTQGLHERTLEKLAGAFGLSLPDFRRTLGMHGPLFTPPTLQGETTGQRRWSGRTEQIAELVETLPAAEQELIARLCAYLHARRGVELPRELLEATR
ncbi:MAG TPA: helix-turn-helix transcriptional regulator [Herpetosiphonaceae bacterium]|nr:helix-turn-helix transcriptional regulator [Herpetosiphonaceae bacterium]